MNTFQTALYGADASPYHLLIVDDDPEHRKLEKEIFQPPRYDVTEAGNGRDALAAIRDRPFDVVLLDKRMAGMDGDEVCRRIRGEMGDAMLPIIMVTGSGSSEELSASLRAGASDFVRKPYSPIELVSRVNAAAERKRLTDQLDTAESVLFALARVVEAKDQNTGDHCSRLAHNAVAFGSALDLGPEELLALRRGGVLHDIGKLGIPDSILLKPSPMTDDEWAVMKKHTVIGAELCSGLRSMRQTVAIIRSHHERLDGGGYPDGLKGDAIPKLARIFQIVDIHDALTHARPYKPALEQPQVIGILQEETRRGWRDPALMAVFIDLLQNRPDDFRIDGAKVDDLGAALFNSLARNGTFTWIRDADAPGAPEPGS